VATLAGAPLELGRLRLQAGAGGGRVGGLRGVVASVVATDGVAGLWRGAGVTLLRDAPFSAIYWGAYEALKRPGGAVDRLVGRGRAAAGTPRAAVAAPPRPGVDTPVHLLCGVGAGVAAAAATVPADVVKTRWQAAERGAAGRGAPDGGLWGVARTIVRDEGVRGLCRGVGPRVAKVAPSCAIMMASYSRSPKNPTPTVATEFQIGLCGSVEADLELFCNWVRVRVA